MRKTTQRLNFTKKVLEKLPTPENSRAICYDSQVKGLGVMTQPSNTRSFFWARKVRGTLVWKTIGECNSLSIEQARGSAGEFNRLAATWKASGYAGSNPFEKAIDGLTLSEIFDRYEAYRKDTAANTNRLKEERARFDHHFKRWSNRSLDSLRRDDIRALHTTIGVDHRTAANRTVQLLRRVINWAKKEELWLGDNVAKGISLFRESSRERFLQPDELPRLFKTLKEETNRDLADFVTLSLTTGARKSNVLAMRWSEISQTADGDRLWTIPQTKNGKSHTVPLVREALVVLQERRRRIPGPWVFPSESKSGHVRDLKRGWKRFLKRAEITDLRVHDLRRTLGSWQAAAGVSLPVIGKSLGHQSVAATAVYSRLHLDPVRAAIETATHAMAVASRKRPKLLEAPRG